MKRSGYSVWWDTELVGGENFKSVILKDLDAAQAVIVIWSPAALTSNWVYSEANRAQAQNKLITVKSADVDFRNIPPPFDILHVDPVEDRNRIFVALGKLGVEAGRGARPHNAADEALWREVLSLRDPDLYIHYLKTFPSGTHAHEADDIIWRGIKTQNAAQGYLWYLREFPGGLYSTEAEDAYWQQQVSQNTFEAYADYLKNRPRGRYRDASDAALWQAASRENSFSAYTNYLAASPAGVNVEVAKLRITRLEPEEKRRQDEEEAKQHAQRAEEQRLREEHAELIRQGLLDEIDACVRYLSKPRVLGARAITDQVFWNLIDQSHSVSTDQNRARTRENYRHYIRFFPSGMKVEVAKRRLENVRDRPNSTT